MAEQGEIVEQHVVVPRTARFYTMGTLGPETTDVWILCHGYGQLASQFLESFQGCGDDTRFLVAPEALSRFYLDNELPHTPASRVGALWMTREDREAEIGDIVSYLDVLYEALLERASDAGVYRDQVRVHALGFSQGAAAVSRWIARGNSHVEHLVLWGGGVPDDVNVRAVRDRVPALTLDLVYGSDDRWITKEALDALKARLDGAAMTYRVHTFTGRHVIDPEMAARIFNNARDGESR